MFYPIVFIDLFSVCNIQTLLKLSKQA